MSSYQKGWIQEVKRDGWTAFKLCWRVKTTEGKWTVKTQTMPRVQPDGRDTNRKAAEKALDVILVEVNGNPNSVAVAVPSVTFNDLMARHWAGYVDNQKMRQSTIDGYNAMLKNWITPYFGAMALSKVTKETVSGFFTKLKEEGKSPQYQKNMYGLVSLIFQLAWTYELIPVTPVAPLIHRPSVDRVEKQVLPMSKAVDFFRAIPEQWRACIAILVLTGMRQGELLGLRWCSIDFDKHLIYKTHVVYRGVLMAGLKTTSKHTVGMSPLMEHILRGVAAGSKSVLPEGYVFSRPDGRPLDPDHVRRYVITPALEAAGIPQQKHGSGLHMFRHTAASVLVEATGNVKSAQDQLGHRSIQTTSDIYTHSNDGQKIASANSLSDAFPELATFLLPANC